MGKWREALARLRWIWFAGCAVWLVNGCVSLYLHAWQHAQLAFVVGVIFLAAGLFYQRQP